MSTTFLSPASQVIADEILDLTDRRRVFLHTVLGVEVPPDDVDAVFDLTDRDRQPDEAEIIDLR